MTRKNQSPFPGSFPLAALSLFCILCTSGCLCTPTLYPPCPGGGLAAFPEEYYGEWTMKMSGGDETWGVRISPCPGKSGTARLELLDEKAGDGNPGRAAVPFVAGAFKVGDTRFLQIGLDVDAVLAAGKFPEDVSSFVKPVHFICETKGSAQRPEWDFITFLRQRNDPENPGGIHLEAIDPDLLYGKEDRVVFNASPELMDFLRNRNYGIAQKVLLVPRERSN